LAGSAQSARFSAGVITMYKDIIATQDACGESHYSSLTDSLANPAHQKFNNIFAKVSLLAPSLVSCRRSLCPSAWLGLGSHVSTVHIAASCHIAF
jgi:hypothetical protein